MAATGAATKAAARLLKTGLRSTFFLLNVWTAFVAAGSISRSGFFNITQIFSCLQRQFQIRVLAWLAAVTYLSIGWKITSVCRSRERQAQLFAARQRTGRGLPVAPPGRSLHEVGRAVDIVFEEDDLFLVVPLARLAGIRWAGENDPVHWER